MIEPGLIGKAMFLVCLRTDNFVFIRIRLEDLSRECDKSEGGSRTLWIFIQQSIQRDTPSNEERFDN